MFIVIGRDNDSVTHREWTQDRTFKSKDKADEYIARLDEACARWDFNITYYTREIPDPVKPKSDSDAPVMATVPVHQTSPLG